ncbi:hypothetical protein NGM99_00955 [Mesorhizobium sp. RP14(2022)]|uniref:Antifreeze protein n=1 Tax=Mesorhizobium liriopis TaxID=2953882 RepID=A0ABT1C146_9HYPH|nr:hypothetical protein [Mesorhizobium liriopis]MCO6048358.1 hypothetical protein [Mesorhizobium liriopis]
MTRFFSRSLAAVAVLAGTEMLVPAAAQAQSIQLDLNSPRPGVRLVDPDAPPPGRRIRSDEDYGNRGCSADDALDKADRMGIRRARVVSERRRSIDVAGRRDGERVVVTFARDRRCSIID